MTEIDLCRAISDGCPPLHPTPTPGFDGQYKGLGGPDRDRRFSVTHQEALILSDLAAGRRVLEIGTGLGVSTVAMAATAQFVVSVDPEPWVRESVRPGDHVALVASIEDTAGPFDMVFIDGLHDTESVRNDIENALRRVKPGGLLVFHDVSQPDVEAAVGSFAWTSRREHPTVGRLTECEVSA